uniref:Uncharacterized protein n=3 Tax=unclassified bacterial viruses TaxID=12333 RepID=A0AAU6W0M8_9VIRU
MRHKGYYQLEAKGFNGETDATDDRIVWVFSPTRAILDAAISGTTCKVEELEGTSFEKDTDFFLPGDSMPLAQQMREWEES